MATQKIKFKMSIKELSFDFEGDVETGQRIQNEIKKTLTAIAHTQEKLLPADPNVIDVEASPPGANGKKVRGPRKTRTKGNSPRGLVIALRQEGYFDEKRDANTIQAKLETMGRKLKGNELSPALIALTQKKILKREKNAENVYEYEKGPNDDVGSSTEEAEGAV
jgi:hypothetical protein